MQHPECTSGMVQEPLFPLLTGLFSESRDGCWLQPSLREPRVVYSRRVHELLGLDPESGKLDRASFLALVHPDDLPACDFFLTDTQSPRVIECRLRHAAGHYLWMRCTALVIASTRGADWAGGTIAAIGQPLRAFPVNGHGPISPERLDRIRSPAFTLSETAHVLNANREAFELLNLEPGDLLGHVFPLTSDPHFASELLRATDRSTRHGQQAIFEALIRGRNWLCHVVPLINGHPEAARFVLICHDISDIYQRAEQRFSAQQELTRTLVKEVHHRIKNNLQGVVGLLRQHMDAGRPATETLTNAISQLISIAAVYGIQSRVDEERIYLCSIINEVAKPIRSTYPGMRISVPGSEKAAALAESHAVPVALIVNELITNAAKHTAPAADAHVDIDLVSTEDFAEVVVVNAPATLPPGFDLQSGKHLGSGLRLAQSLLPAKSAALSIQQQGDSVCARLRLSRPQVISPVLRPPS